MAPRRRERRQTAVPQIQNNFGIVFDAPFQSERYASLSRRPVKPTRRLHWEQLDQMGYGAELRQIFERMAWMEFSKVAENAYESLTKEFLSSFILDERRGIMRFRLKNEWHELNKEEVASVFSFGDGICFSKHENFPYDQLWRELTGGRVDAYTASNTKASLLISDIDRIIHRFLTYTFFAREGSNGHVNQSELYLLHCIREGVTIDSADYLMRRFQFEAVDGTGDIVMGGFITAIARELGVGFARTDANSIARFEDRYHYIGGTTLFHMGMVRARVTHGVRHYEIIPPQQRTREAREQADRERAEQERLEREEAEDLRRDAELELPEGTSAALRASERATAIATAPPAPASREERGGHREPDRRQRRRARDDAGPSQAEPSEPSSSFQTPPTEDHYMNFLRESELRQRSYMTEVQSAMLAQMAQDRLAMFDRMDQDRSAVFARMDQDRALYTSRLDRIDQQQIDILAQFQSFQPYHSQYDPPAGPSDHHSPLGHSPHGPPTFSLSFPSPSLHLSLFLHLLLLPSSNHKHSPFSPFSEFDFSSFSPDPASPYHYLQTLTLCSRAQLSHTGLGGDFRSFRTRARLYNPCSYIPHGP